MKELFNTLSTASEFLKEKRFIFLGGETPNPLEPPPFNPENSLEPPPFKPQSPDAIASDFKKAGNDLFAQSKLKDGLNGISLDEDRMKTGNFVSTVDRVAGINGDRVIQGEEINIVADANSKDEAAEKAFQGARVGGADIQNIGLRGLSLADEQLNIAKEVDKKSDEQGKEPPIIAKI